MLYLNTYKLEVDFFLIHVLVFVQMQQPQVIIQEITLPEGMTLDQGLALANQTLPQNPRTVTPRGSSESTCSITSPAANDQFMLKFNTGHALSVSYLFESF